MQEPPSLKDAQLLKEPPLLKVIKEKEYKAKHAEYDQEPYMVIKNNSCKASVQLVGEDDIVGFNVLGTKAILDGAVFPTTPWLKYLFETGESQVANYTEKYPKQSDLIAQIQDLLLKESLKIMVNVAKLKAAIAVVSPSAKFLNKLKLPTIRVDPPVFTADLVQKYIWAVKKLDLGEEDFDALLGTLDADGNAIDCTKVECKFVTDVYDYSKTAIIDISGSVETPIAAPTTPAAPTAVQSAAPTAVQSAVPAAVQTVSTAPTDQGKQEDVVSPENVKVTAKKTMKNRLRSLPNPLKTLKNKFTDRNLLKTIASMTINTSPSELNKYNSEVVKKHSSEIIEKASQFLIEYMKTLQNTNGQPLFKKNTKGNLIAWTFSHDAYKDVPQFKQLLVWFTYLNSIVDDSNKQSMKDLFPYINALEYVYTAKLPSSKPPILTDLCKTLECFPPTEPAPQGHWSTSVKN